VVYFRATALTAAILRKNGEHEVAFVEPSTGSGRA